ncbi:glycosyltransferase family 39 protein [Pedobacter sp. BS3]|uniref:ArnT family glycosyltransferase n=1 Tax=Pedobacter sp. BS3 TaxID=2567937 RepID=UPI0011EEB09C|nr:glycosyltransferase family 39 protein [Pedobacter sp. BS3]TZF83833.1 glycosyltransferase family 39 protein [Pedobacter sp. BS3]
MSVFRRNPREAQLILLYACLKLAINLLANRHLGFHRDELLYIAYSKHPGWGYNEAPPFTGYIAWLSGHLFGDSLYAYRLFPAIFSALTTYFTGLLTIAFGGKRFAVSVACLGAIFSPAFMGSQYLLQPVVFEQFFWIVIAYLLVKYVQTRHINYVYWFALTFGFGLLTNYTIAVYAISLLIALLFSPQRKYILNKHVFIALLLAFLIALPNLLWQYQHHFPAIAHFKHLYYSLAIYISTYDYLLEQVLIYATGILIWLPGLVYLFVSRTRIKYTFVSVAFIIIQIILLLLHSKLRYSFGAYLPLFAAGGIAWQKLLMRLSERTHYVLLTVCLVPALVFVPLAIPVLPLPATLSLFDFTYHRLHIKFPLKWSDQEYHEINQTYADMLGWDEIAQYTVTAWEHQGDEQDTTIILADNYGLAGAIDHLGKSGNLPPVICTSSSYMLWAPEAIRPKHIIYAGNNEVWLSAFEKILKVGEVSSPHASEKGTPVYLLSNPVKDINAIYTQELKEHR